MTDQKKRFHRHKWEAKTFAAPEDIRKTFFGFNLHEKKIKAVHVLGYAENFSLESVYARCTGALCPGEAIEENILSSSDPRFDTVTFPRAAVLCNPVVFIFEDDTTFELLPYGKDGLKMAVNAIDPEIIDDINDTNIDSEKLFAGLKGCSFINMSVRIKADSEDPFFSLFQTERSYRFYLSNEKTIQLRQKSSVPAEYIINVLRDPERKKSEKLSFKEMQDIVKDNHQIVIYEGFSRDFKICPAKLNPEYNENADPRFCQQYIKKYEEMICLDEDDFDGFLYYFMEKYYDNTLPGNHESFEWNRNNIYTRGIVIKMLYDIDYYASHLRDDPDDPEVKAVRDRFWSALFLPYSKRFIDRSEEEKQHIISENIDVAVDFYERFTERMRVMLEQALDCMYISFEGP